MGVELYDVTGGGQALVASLTSNAWGYGFPTVASGRQYKVRFVAPSGYAFSPKYAGGTPSGTDSDANADGWTDSFTLGAGQNVTTIDAGLVAVSPPPPPPPPPLPGSIGNRVWLDAIRNDVQDAQELNAAGVSGVGVELYWVVQGTTQFLSQTTTGPDGSYLFSSVPGGADYQLRFSAPGYNFVVQGVGGPAADSDAFVGSGWTTPFPVGSGVNRTDIDAGLYPSVGHSTSIGTSGAMAFGAYAPSGYQMPEGGFGGAGGGEGEGGGGTGTGGGGPPSLPPPLSRHYAVGGSRSAEATIGDDDSKVVVSRVAVTAGAPLRGAVGSFGTATVTTFTDTDTTRGAGDFAAEIDWGNGTKSAGTVTGWGGWFAVAGIPPYARPGEYPVAVTVTAVYRRDPSDAASPVSVEKATAVGLSAVVEAPAVALTPAAGVAATARSGLDGVRVATFAAAGGAGDYAAQVWLGDGSAPAAAAVTDLGGGTLAVVVSGRQYQLAGTYSARVVVRDVRSRRDPGGVVVGSAAVAVAVADPDLATAGFAVATDPRSVAEGATLAANTRLATVRPAGGTAIPPVTAATVLWSDGTTDAATVTAVDLGGGLTAYEVRVSPAAGRFRTPGVLGAAIRFTAGGVVRAVGTTVAVGEAAVTANGPPAIEVPVGGGGTQVRIAEFQSADATDAAAEYEATVWLGDGAPVTGTVYGSGGRLWVGVPVQYARVGNYGAVVRLRPVGVPWAATEAVVGVTVADTAEGRPAAVGGSTVARLESADGFDDVRAWVSSGPGGSLGSTGEPGYLGSGGGGSGGTGWWALFEPAGLGEAVPQLAEYGASGVTAAYYDLTPPAEALPVPADAGQRWFRSELVKGDDAGDARLREAVADAPLGVATVGVPPEGAVAGVPLPAFHLFTLSDPDPDATDPSRYPVYIDWGDGTTVGATVWLSAANEFAVTAPPHTYAAAGTYWVSAYVRDAESGWSPSGGLDSAATLLTRLPVTVAPAPAAGILNAAPRTDAWDDATWVPAGGGEISANTGTVRTFHALDFDRSPGTDVGLNPTLVYDSATADPRPVIEATLPADVVPTGAVTATLVMRSPDGTTVLSTTTRTFDPTSWPSAATLSLRPDAPLAADGVYRWEMTATVPTADGILRVLSKTGTVAVAANTAGPFGAGWGLSSVWRLKANADGAGGALMVAGDGDTRYFASTGAGFRPPPGDAGTLEEFGPWTIYADPFGAERWFDASGRQVKVVDRHGLITGFAYDGNGDLSQVTTTDGNVVAVSYGVVQGIDPDTLQAATFSRVRFAESGSRPVTLLRDLIGDLRSVALADDTRLFSYTTDHRLTADRWVGHNVGAGDSAIRTTYRWGTGDRDRAAAGYALGDDGPNQAPPASNWLVASAAARGLWAGTTAPPAAADVGVGTVADPRGNATRDAVDFEGRLNKVTYADQATERWLRDASGWAWVHVDPRGYHTLAVPDLKTRQVAVLVTPDLGVRSYGYGTNGQVEFETDGAGRLTRYKLDGLGDRLEARDPLGNTTKYAYYEDLAKVGLLKSVTDARNVTVWQGEYDGHRRLTAELDAAGAVRERNYDLAGNPIWQTVQTPGEYVPTQDRKSWTEYDAANRLTETRVARLMPTGQVEEVTTGTVTYFGGTDLATSALDDRGARTVNVYDSRGWLDHVTEAYGDAKYERTTTYVYDAAGNAVTVTAPAYGGGDSGLVTVDATTRTAYDERNRASKVTEGDGTDKARSTYFVYDKAGNVAETKASQKYDPFLLGLEAAVPGGSKPYWITTTRAYDPMGRVAVVAAGLTSSDAQGRKTVTAYDRSGLVETVTNWVGIATDPVARTTRFGYDAAGRQVAVTEASGTPYARTTDTKYDKVGNVERVTDAGGRKTDFTYDKAGRRESVVEAAGTAVQRTTGYRYNVYGDLEYLDAPRGYDYLGGLFFPPSRGAYVSTKHEYDVEGRLVTSTEAVNATFDPWTPTVDGSRAANAPTLWLTHAAPVTKYKYDAHGDLELVTDPLGRKTKYEYDVFGRTTARMDGWVIGSFINRFYASGTETAYDAADNAVAILAVGTRPDDITRNDWVQTTRPFTV